MLVPQKNYRPFSWVGEVLGGSKGSLKISDIRKLRALHSRVGGVFVVYLRSASFLWFSRLSTKLVLVCPNESRRLRGLLVSLFSVLFGWWSFEGMLNTLLVLAHNFLGGFDLTQRILDAKTENGWLDWETDDLNRKFQRQRFRLFLGILVAMFLIVLPLVGILVFDLLDKWLR